MSVRLLGSDAVDTPGNLPSLVPKETVLTVPGDPQQGAQDRVPALWVGPKALAFNS